METKTMRACRDIRQAGWNSLSERWGSAILMLILYEVLFFALSFTVIGGILVAGAFMLGLTTFFMAGIRKKESSINMLFSGFSNFGNVLIASILQVVFIFLWSLLLFVPGIIKAYSYSMTYYIMHDESSISGDAAITKSRKMMDGYKGKLFLLELSFIGWYLLGIVTFGIAMIWVLPYTYAARAAFYEELKQIKNPNSAEDKKEYPLEVVSLQDNTLQDNTLQDINSMEDLSQMEDLTDASYKNKNIVDNNQTYKDE